MKKHEPISPECLGARIRELRLKRDMTLEELADLAGISQTTLGNTERGTNDPGWRMVVAVANALEMPIEELAKPAENLDLKPRMGRRGRPSMDEADVSWRAFKRERNRATSARS